MTQLANTEDTPLHRKIHESLHRNPGSFLRFDKFMETALYDPEHGYYSGNFGRKIGRGGDFYTSVSVGDTFGLLLGLAMGQCDAGNQDTFAVVEQGAHDGQLAHDIVDSLAERNCSLYAALNYSIVEPRASWRQGLSNRLESGKIEVVASVNDIDSSTGLFLCNELLDAFPVRRFVYRDREWREQVVRVSEDKLTLATVAIDTENDPGFAEFLSLLDGDGFADGYTTEYCEGMASWVEQVAALFPESGRWWVIDYGFLAPDYFAESRTTGTLRCYHQHRSLDDPLFRPGETDITAHVNFTQLIRLAEVAGLKLKRHVDQATFLTHAARSWLLEVERRGVQPGDAARLRQFQTLTHPGMMGRSFQVLEFTR